MLVSLYGFILREKRGKVAERKEENDSIVKSLSLSHTQIHTNTNRIVHAMGKGVFKCFFFLLLTHSIYRKFRNYS